VKKTKLAEIPVVVQIYPQQIHEADLMRELRVDKHSLDRELERNPRRYGFWAALYSEVSAKVSDLEDRLAVLEANLFIKYAKANVAKRKTDLKFYVVRNEKYMKLKRRLRNWQNSERTLKYSAMRGIEMKQSSLMALNANRRADKKSEGFKEEE
jgi:hypothetical protein